jgi:uncharacterized damage-inducible protein DinB
LARAGVFDLLSASPAMAQGVGGGWTEMSLNVNVEDLLAYSEWERESWRAWFRERGAGAFTTSFGPNGDGRFGTVADVVRHIFSAEMRYVDRLSGRALTDPSSIPTELEDLFEFGRRSRRALEEFIARHPNDRWDVPRDHPMLANQTMRLTDRKIVVHVVLHEIRHWAQIATVLRHHGLKTELHDLLLSPVLG